MVRPIVMNQDRKRIVYVLSRYVARKSSFTRKIRFYCTVFISLAKRYVFFIRRDDGHFYAIVVYKTSLKPSVTF